jgi:N6-adenosine-specific RNA methylase IME4
VTVTPDVVLPAGKYAILLADPPWQYDFVEADNRAIENQYPTLTADQIACYEDSEGRSIADVAADDAVLFLWATNPKLTEAMTVIRGWGFEYLTNMVWVKDRIGMGYWARARHELLLIARRGAMSPPAVDLRPDSVIEAPRGAHSAKPASVYELLEAIWPDTPKVEIFGRNTRPGWATYGNQVPE